MLPATLACPPNKNVVSLPIIPLTISPANVKTWEATHAILSTKKKPNKPTHTSIQEAYTQWIDFTARTYRSPSLC